MSESSQCPTSIDMDGMLENVIFSCKRVILQDETLIKEAIDFFTHDPHLVRSYLRIERAYAQKDWVTVMEQVTEILNDPSSKEFIQNALKTHTHLIRKNRDIWKSRIHEYLSSCDNKHLRILQAAFPLVMAFVQLFQDFGTKRLLHGFVTEVKKSIDLLIDQTCTSQKKKLFQR